MAGEIVENKEEKSEVKPEIKKEKNRFKIDWKSQKFLFGLITIVVLLVIIILSTWIRTQNISQLKDITDGNYTLGPDLDPYLYLRHAHEIVSHTLKEPDIMRGAPVGTANYAKTNLMPWAIVALYKILDVFFEPPTATLEFASIILPVILVSLTLLVFFFFVRKLFLSATNKTNSTIIALIATAFYAVIPEMLHRTTGGIPEIEGLGMLFFWLAFLFFVSAWQEKNLKKIILFALLSGISTGLMIFAWGGYRYIFMTFTLATFLVFLFEKQKKKNFLIYAIWAIVSLISSLIRGASISGLFTSFSDTALASVMLSILVVDALLFNTKLKKIKDKIKLPESIISLIVGAIIALLGALVVFGPSFIPNAFSMIVERLLYPFGRERIGLTVAENKAPFFVEVFTSFSWLFWVFFAGTILLFYEAVKHFDKKKKIWLNILFILFLLTFIFSRISPTSFLNGENFISRFLYFGGLIVFVVALISIYIRAYVKKDDKTLQDFKEINFSYLLTLAFIFWMIISMRGAIRLFFIISPALILAAAFLPVKISEYISKTKDDLYKILLWCVIIVAAIFLVLTFINYTKNSATQAKYTIPGPYYQQWQQAMAWTRENTAQDAIFAHWWDYGFWVQTLGERATVTDGAHAVTEWDHFIGRYLLTAQNEKTALQFCKAHNVSYVLIDSTDIGKYPAYGSIGSDSTGRDRLSWVSTYVLNEAQTQDSKNETAYVYTGGAMLDEDLTWNNQIFPASSSGIAGFILVIDKETTTINDVQAVLFSNKQQFRIPVRYVYINNQRYDIAKDKAALNTTFYIIPRITQQGVNNMGAAFYISEKAAKTQWVRLYLLNETENFELVHQEDALFIQQLRDVYNVTIGDFLYTNDLLGPIKIWKVNYPPEIKDYPEYRELGVNIDVDKGWAKLDYLGT